MAINVITNVEFCMENFIHNKLRNYRNKFTQKGSYTKLNCSFPR